MRALSKISVLLLLAACAHKDAFLIGGDTLDNLGAQFVEIAQYTNEAHKNHAISDDQYNKFRTFGMKFQIAYPAAVQLWHIAVLTNDAALEGKAIDALILMLPELIEFGKDVGVIVRSVK